MTNIQFSIITVTYLEWNRSLPHSWFIRCYWCMAAGTYAIKMYNLVRTSNKVRSRNISSPRCNCSPPTAYTQPGQGNDKMMLASTVLMSMHGLLAFLGLVGIIPGARKYMEANIKLAERKTGVCLLHFLSSTT